MAISFLKTDERRLTNVSSDCTCNIVEYYIVAQNQTKLLPSTKVVCIKELVVYNSRDACALVHRPIHRSLILAILQHTVVDNQPFDSTIFIWKSLLCIVMICACFGPRHPPYSYY